MEPCVSTRSEPEFGAVKRYQIERPPALPSWLGSPGSLVALRFVPVIAPELPVRTCALANMSFGGITV